MSDKPNYNYMVNVICPHCTARLVVAVSGFAGELAVREKECRKCGKEFLVHLLTVTSPRTETASDSHLAFLKSRINHLNKARKDTLMSLLIRHETATRLYREALEEARRQRDLRELN